MGSTSTSGGEEQAPDPFLVLEPPNNKIKFPLSVNQFDVFINHRGPDVKTTLALQLYNSLQKAGISAYLDSEATEVGDYFLSAIKNAILSSTVHIAIFSPQYAESACCLAELALMFQTKARIIPLFYNVEPSDFRYIKGGVADAFYKHEEKDRYTHNDIQRWKDCLQSISFVKGYELNGQDDDLNKLYRDVVSAVVKEKKKREILLQVTICAEGHDELVKDFQIHCQMRNTEMRDKIIRKFGMGGSCKSTLAKDLFNRKHSKFSRSTIQFDVRENDLKDMHTSLQSGPSTRLRPRSSKPKVKVVKKVAVKALRQSASSKTISKSKKKVTKPIPSKNSEDKNMYFCDAEGCTMKFSSKNDLNLHKRNICTFKGCGKHFFSYKYLVQHGRVHLDDRPLCCPWKGCELTFKWAWARTEHIRFHTGERPWVCKTAGCGQTFRFVSDLSRHKRKAAHLNYK